MSERKRGTAGTWARRTVERFFDALGVKPQDTRKALRGMLAERAPLVARAMGIAPTDATAAVPIVEAVLTEETVASIRRTLREHEEGDFYRSAALALHILRDPDLFGALNQRVLGLLGCEILVSPSEDSAAADEFADLVRERFGAVVPRSAACEILNSAALLGFGVGHIVETWDEELSELVPRLDYWPSHAVQYDKNVRKWYALTTTGRQEITPGDGEWLLYAPRSKDRPFYFGAIRCIAEWYLRAQYAGADASKHAEVHGIPVWLAELPDSQRETPNAAAFIRSIRNMGRNAVVPLPQGATPETSYNLRLEQAKTDAYQIFEFLMRTAGGKFRLAINGQDLTGQNNKVGTNASSSTGREVSAEIREADAVTFAECLRAQLFRPWAAYRSNVKHAPLIAFDTETPEDASARAASMKALGEAASVWVVDLGLGDEVDVRELARQAKVPLILKAGGARHARGPLGTYHRGARLASGGDDPLFVAGQRAADRVTKKTRALLSEQLDPHLDALTDAINGAQTPQELRDRLTLIVGSGDVAKLEVTLARARTIARKVGRWAVVGDPA